MDILKNLPINLTEESSEISNDQSNTSQQTETNNLTIAWQYQKYLNNKETEPSTANITTSKTNTTKLYCHSYDLNRHIKEEKITTNPLIHQLFMNNEDVNTVYTKTFIKVANIIEKDYTSDMTDKTKEKSILRIAINSIGSPTIHNENDRDMLLFLHALRGLMRSSLAVCMITIPAYLFNSTQLKKIEHLVDCVVQFQSFSGNASKVPESFKEYDGLFNVIKLPLLNSMISHTPETLKYIFRVGRRKLHLEIPHMGPEESRTPSSDSSSLLCVPGPPTKKNQY